MGRFLRRVIPGEFHDSSFAQTSFTVRPRTDGRDHNCPGRRKFSVQFQRRVFRFKERIQNRPSFRASKQPAGNGGTGPRVHGAKRFPVDFWRRGRPAHAALEPIKPHANKGRRRVVFHGECRVVRRQGFQTAGDASFGVPAGEGLATLLKSAAEFVHKICFMTFCRE
jgi:hypothetical protein